MPTHNQGLHTMLSLRSLCLTLIILGLGVAGTTTAQAAGNQPIDITATNLGVDQKGNTATFSGNVKVVQGDTTLTSDKLTATYNGGVIENIVATGNVRMVRKNGVSDEVATGSAATYKPGSQLMTMTGGVTLTRGTNTLRGQTLTYNIASGQINLGGGGSVTGRFSSKSAPALPQIKGATGMGSSVSRSFNLPVR